MKETYMHFLKPLSFLFKSRIQCAFIILFLFLLLPFCLLGEKPCSSFDDLFFSRSDSVPFLKQAYNIFQSTDRQQPQRLATHLLNASKQKITIAHFGDSHIQSDEFVSVVRKLLQRKYGNSGRGMIFPYAIAKTYSQTDYTSSFTGNWKTASSIQTPPSIALGISGFVGKTSDSIASVHFRFKSSFPNGTYRMKLFCADPSNVYTVTLINGIDTIARQTDQTKPFLEFNCRSISDTLIWYFQKKESDTTSFFLYGISIEQDQPGIIYHNLGVGGANYSALLHQQYTADQLSSIRPDIVVFDWGTNDIIYTNSISDTLRQTIKKCIQKVRAIVPEAIIVLPTVQDMRWRGRHVTACRKFSDLVREVATEESCFLYDWYYVAGGKGSVYDWGKQLLIQKDQIHLTRKGYQLKAELFVDAIQKTIGILNDSTLDGSFFLDIPESEHLPLSPPVSEVPKQKKKNPKEKDKKSKKGTKPTKGNKQEKSSLYHTVKKGESLATIAKKYKITVAALRQMNHLKSDKVAVGKKLKIR